MAALRYGISFLVLENISVIRYAYSWNIFLNIRRDISYLRAAT